nr:hypothetical protein [Borrelia miyamotoi]
MIGCVVSSIIAAFLGVADHAPHIGPIVLPVINNKLGFIIVMFVAVVVAQRAWLSFSSL